MAVGDVEEVPMHPPDAVDKKTTSSKPFIAFSKKRFLIVIIILVLLVVMIGVLSGVISAKYAEERTRKQLLEDKDKRDLATTPAAATAKPTLGPEPWYQVRLPDNVLPVHYDLYLHPNLTTDTFQGNVSILVEVTEATEYVLIHINEMTITQSSVLEAKAREGEYETGKELDVKQTLEYKDNHFYVFIMKEKLQPGKYVVRMSYKAVLSGKVLNGLYLSTYTDKQLGERKLVTTKFQPTDTRKALPCFDEPAMKATFTTTIVHDPDYTALTNMPEDSNTTLANGIIATKFQKSVRMSTYLLAFIVCDFAHNQITTGQHNNITLRVWTTRDQVHQTDFALDVAGKIITFFEEYYKVPYPLPKQDLIAIPDFSSGAMENWGLITFRETRLLYKKGVSSEGNKQRIAITISHELAHQWFGNLVSPKWWNDLWLNEGFASYVEYLGVDHVHRDWEVMAQFLLLDLQLVFPLDSLVSSHPISVEVDHPKKIKQIFDRISYSKGASIIRMLAGFLGDDTFTKGLEYYLQTYAFNNAETKDLWNALGKVSQTDVKTIMDTWTFQMGYPVVTVKRNGDKVTLSQKHFLLDPNANVTVTSPYDYKWYIPFTYITKDKPNASSLVWMNKTSAEATVPAGGWIKGNYKQYGYYRVHYDKDNWEALSKQLNDNPKVFSPADRSSLINDAFSLARVGLVDYTTALDMLKYLDKEDNYVPWITALNSLSYLKTVLGSRPCFGNLQKFIRNKVRPQVVKLGWVPQQGHIEKLMQVSLLATACNNGDKDAKKNATKIFMEWKDDERDEIDVNIRSLVYRYAIANTGSDQWNWLFQKFQNTTDASERSKIMAALGSSDQPWILNKYLESSLNPSLIRSQDMVSVISYVAYNPVGKNLAWDFARSNWKMLLETFGTSTFRMTSLVNAITHGFNTEVELDDMQRFFAESVAGTSESARKQAIERTKNNIEWLKKNEAQVEDWLRKNV